MSVKPIVLSTRRLPKEIQARAMEAFQFHAHEQDEPLSQAEILDRLDQTGAAGMIISVRDQINEAFLSKVPESLKAIAAFSVGVDHVDVAAAKARGIAVGNTPGVLTDATAEIALLLMLGAGRRAVEGMLEVREDGWEGWRPTHLMGTQLSGKRLGIVGMGRIGVAVATRAQAFGMEIHYHNRREVAACGVANPTYHKDLESLLAVSDFLSLHCPSTPETRHLMNATTLAKLPDGAILINTARGDVVEDEAVVAALRSGKLAAAGLDVFAGEPNMHPAYRDLPNVFALPHLGSATVETRNAMGHRALDNLDAFFKGEAMPFPVG